MRDVSVGIAGKGALVPGDVELVVFHEGSLNEIMKRRPDEFIKEAGEIAVRFGIYVVPGLYIRDGYLCSCMIDRNGRVAGEQRGTHINMKWFSGLKRCEEIKLIDTPFGRVFLCVDIDVYKPEVMRIAALLGADIAVCSQYIGKEDFSEYMVLSGPWQEAQQNCMYIVSSTNYSGYIIGPCETAEDSSGFLRKTEQNEAIYHRLLSEKRRSANESFPVLDSLNFRLYKEHARELCL